MFLNLFISLRGARIPVSLREYLTFLECLVKRVISHNIEDFSYNKIVANLL